METNPFKVNLRQIAQYTVSAGRVKRQYRYICYLIYSWGNDFIALLAGIGIGYPALTSVNSGGSTPPSKYLSSHEILQVGILAAVAWIVLKLIVTRDNGIKRAVLMKNCVKEMQLQESDLVRNVLKQTDPLPRSAEIIDALARIYDQHNREEAWPWTNGFAENIDNQVEHQIELWYLTWQKNVEQREAVASVSVVSNLRRESPK
jgi:hypothetical protein